ncbi:MAG: ABC transporter permease [Anaerolineales bacterium]|nr:ABC transporter permease [Anaerolineales bacterium]
MASFLTRRISFIMLVAVLIVFFTFIGMNMISNSERAAPNFSLLDHGDIAWDRTQDYFGALFHGNLGEATLGGVSLPIGEIIGQSYLNSMGLLFVALIGAACLGLYFGALAALIRFRRLVLPLLTITILGVSTPSFVAALILQLGELKYVQVFGRRLVSMGGFGWDYEHMLLPVLVLMARPLAYLTRATFIALRRIMEENYIRTAFAKGLSRRTTINIHAFRNLAVPVLTAVGVSLRFSLSSLPVVELFFGWPGLGLQLVQAIDARETTLTVSLAFLLGLTFLVFNFLLDIAYRIVDPRVREAG